MACLLSLPLSCHAAGHLCAAARERGRLRHAHLQLGRQRARDVRQRYPLPGQVCGRDRRRRGCQAPRGHPGRSACQAALAVLARQLSPVSTPPENRAAACQANAGTSAVAPASSSQRSRLGDGTSHAALRVQASCSRRCSQTARCAWTWARPSWSLPGCPPRCRPRRCGPMAASEPPAVAGGEACLLDRSWPGQRVWCTSLHTWVTPTRAGACHLLKSAAAACLAAVTSHLSAELRPDAGTSLQAPAQHRRRFRVARKCVLSAPVRAGRGGGAGRAGDRRPAVAGHVRLHGQPPRADLLQRRQAADQGAPATRL